ncbi:MAG TPA: MGMT family protein [Pirellulaceae bacterium]|jgi:methylated-DNA-[protein]-cysteine S-methyltransferase|nr:MGMT family protein [Pirellulaceae bacterium]
MPLSTVTSLNVVDLVRTEFGWCGFRWESEALAAIVVGYETPAEAARAALGETFGDVDVRSELGTRRSIAKAGLPDAAALLAEAFTAYAEGEGILFPQVKLARVPSTSFAAAVLEGCLAIPYGEVRSYGELAAAAGSPRASRAVGNVMRTNRYPILIPCHRVVAAQGRLGGYSSPKGLDFKRRLLAMESCERTAPNGS